MESASLSVSLSLSLSLSVCVCLSVCLSVCLARVHTKQQQNPPQVELAQRSQDLVMRVVSEVNALGGSECAMACLRFRFQWCLHKGPCPTSMPRGAPMISIAQFIYRALTRGGQSGRRRPVAIALRLPFQLVTALAAYM